MNDETLDLVIEIINIKRSSKDEDEKRLEVLEKVCKNNNNLKSAADLLLYLIPTDIDRDDSIILN